VGRIIFDYNLGAYKPELAWKLNNLASQCQLCSLRSIHVPTAGPGTPLWYGNHHV